MFPLVVGIEQEARPLVQVQHETAGGAENSRSTTDLQVSVV